MWFLVISNTIFFPLMMLIGVILYFLYDITKIDIVVTVLLH